MKTLYLYLDIWRCGQNSQRGKNGLGRGCTQLRNDQGFECCLGMFAKQIDLSITDSDILSRASPASIKRLPLSVIPHLTVKDTDPPRGVSSISNSPLSSELMCINDDTATTIQEKIIAIEFLLQSEGFQLVVI